MTETLQPEQIKRVVVRGANWVGDAVMTVAALRELRRVLPGAHITLATRPWARGIFAGTDIVDELLPIDDEQRGLVATLRQITEWRARRFDLALLFPNAFKPAFVAAAARVPLRVGYATDGRGFLLTHPLAPPAWRSEQHEVFYYLNLVFQLEHALTGAAQFADREPQYQLQVSAERRTAARTLLSRHGALNDRPLVALCPGSTNSRAKRWPAASYAALADHLMGKAKVNVALIGAREELDVTQEVLAKMRRRPIVLTGETDLAGTVAVLDIADLLVTNDTGPAHISAALERPTLVIFGPTNPVTTRPFSPTADIIRRPPECAPCMLRDCPIDHRCMTAITPEEVFLRAVEMLAHAQCEAHPAHDEAHNTTIDATAIDAATIDAATHEAHVKLGEVEGGESTREVGAEVA
ncbi:MAG TPA: lipopolysaccharide heptosyltransferase II [Pyrinomonadaceae bacterium]|jgi:heptosyltransferase-2|nr:lipopolysaccharide heptosyltransferase II [Pyrinomonadaceae bacterium]